MKIKAATKVVVCVSAPPEKTKSGLVLTLHDKQPEIGTVVDIGSGKTPILLKVGDKIAYRRFSEAKITIVGEEYIFVPFLDILAKIIN